MRLVLSLLMSAAFCVTTQAQTAPPKLSPEEARILCDKVTRNRDGTITIGDSVTVRGIRVDRNTLGPGGITVNGVDIYLFVHLNCGAT